MQNSSSTSNQRPLTEFSDLNLSVKATTDYFKKINKNFVKLKNVNDSLIDFNDAFSAFLFGMAANDSTTTWINPPSTNTIERHKEHIKRINSLEATKPIATTRVEENVQKPTLSRERKRVKITPSAKKEPLISKRKFVTKVNINTIIAHLPIKYRERTDARDYMETFLKILRLHPGGLTKKELVSETKLPQYTVAECIGALTHAKEIIHISEAGQYSKFLLDPNKYFSEDKEHTKTA